MKIAIIGTGHVGLISGVCFAELGNEVTCIDSDKQKIENLKKGILPIYEPGLEELLEKNKTKINFINPIAEGIKDSGIIFICVSTPAKPSGDADLSAVENVATQIAHSMKDYKLVVEKSTVPVQTGIRIKQLMKELARGIPFDVASNPEFLREGSAVYDFMHPDRIVIGVETERAKNILTELHKKLGAPILVTDIESAELIKHASNSFLATKISFINAVANVCELAGADVKKVARGMGLDHRIGQAFLEPGIGFGGSCFPKDLSAFRKIAEKLGYKFNLLEEVEKINAEMKMKFVSKVEDSLWNVKGKTIGVLGLAFKPDTEDMREAPSIDIIERLLADGAIIKAYDPKAMPIAKNIFPDITYCNTPYEAADGADCLCVLTEWDEFKKLDLKCVKSVLKNPIILDGRNILDKAELESLGFKHKRVGR